LGGVVAQLIERQTSGVRLLVIAAYKP